MAVLVFGPTNPYEIDENGQVSAFAVSVRGEPPFGLAFDSRTAEEQADEVVITNGLTWQEDLWSMRPGEADRVVRRTVEGVIFEITLFHIPVSIRELIWSGDERAGEVADAFLESAGEAIESARKGDPTYDWIPKGGG